MLVDLVIWVRLCTRDLRAHMGFLKCVSMFFVSVLYTPRFPFGHAMGRATFRRSWWCVSVSTSPTSTLILSLCYPGCFLRHEKRLRRPPHSAKWGSPFQHVDSQVACCDSHDRSEVVEGRLHCLHPHCSTHSKVTLCPFFHSGTQTQGTTALHLIGFCSSRNKLFFMFENWYCNDRLSYLLVFIHMNVLGMA